jgi:hypothetical protein
MAKKKKYVPSKDDDWDEEEIKKHRLVIKDKEVAINKKYKRWWDTKKKKWKPGFDGHES